MMYGCRTGIQERDDQEYPMPLFAYTCNACGVEAELLIRGSEAPQCPACNGADLEKQLSHIRPMATSAPEPVACGAGQCPRMQDGGCCMN